MADDPFESGQGSDIDAQRLRVEAIGEPGRRRFRLLALVDGETHIIWMEKQQMQALGLALEQMLDQLPERGLDLGTPDVPIEFDTQTRRQFRVGRMELGFDERRNQLVIVAHDIAEDEEDGEPSFNCRLSRAQARALSADAATVVAAGRPRCTMCGSPMGPGPHVCPQQNGHLPLSLAETDTDVEEG